ncbi:hypothetical protein GCM10010421_15940 [Streptomyces glaucus]|uniref:Secreted protein n=1 Tax=Streptomyces glaucus TaxID=284029 RepID=A0ABP5WJM7_9ACTN
MFAAAPTGSAPVTVPLPEEPAVDPESAVPTCRRRPAVERPVRRPRRERHVPSGRGRRGRRGPARAVLRVGPLPVPPAKVSEPTGGVAQ